MPDQPQNRFTRDDLANHTAFLHNVKRELRQMQKPEYNINKYRNHLVCLIHILDQELHRIGGSVS